MTQSRIKAGDIQNILVNLVLTSAANLIQEKGPEKEEWITERILAQVEQYDHLIPALKDYADLPYVDELEKKSVKELVRFCVRKAYTWALAHGHLPTQQGTPPTPEPSPEDKQVADALGVPADSILTPANIAATNSTIRPLMSIPNPSSPPAPEQPSDEDKDKFNQTTPESTPNAVQDTGAGSSTGQGSDPEEPDYAALTEDYAKGGGWYNFPPEGKKELTDSDTPVKIKGKEAAIEYLKTRDDLVFE